MLKCLEPRLSIQLYEVTDGLAQESSDGWNNAGTGHAGICELRLHAETGGRRIGERQLKAIGANSLSTRSSLELRRVHRHGGSPRSLLCHPAPRFFVHGEEQIDFLRARHAAMSAHHFFHGMGIPPTALTIASWAPLLLEAAATCPSLRR